MDNNARQEIDTFSLPRTFWLALWEVRIYLIQNLEFVDRIYGPGRDDSLRYAFDLMDDYLKKTLEDHQILEE